MEEHSAHEGDELVEHFRLTVDPGQQPERIDRFLTNKMMHTSRNKIQNASKAGCLLVNGMPVKANYKVRPNDAISLVLPKPVTDYKIIPENIPLNIMYEDDDLLIINKEPGMVVHPGIGNFSGTLVHALAHHLENLPKRELDSLRPGIVHRIDKMTSGLMVVAKTEYALSHLTGQFYDKQNINRTYQAIVWGHFDEKQGTIEGDIGRNLKNRKVFTVYSDDVEGGKHAVTHYKVLEDFGYVSLVECVLETGRTHQIRVHMKHIGHTLFGDKDYGGDKVLKGTIYTKYRQFVENCFKLLPRQALHAKTLGFVHPITGNYVEFESELPDDMRKVLSKWRTYTSALRD